LLHKDSLISKINYKNNNKEENKRDKYNNRNTENNGNNTYESFSLCGIPTF